MAESSRQQGLVVEAQSGWGYSRYKAVVIEAMDAVHAYRQIPLSGSCCKQAKEEHQQALQKLFVDFSLFADQVHLVEAAAEFGLQVLEKELSADPVVMGAISRNIMSGVFVCNSTDKVVGHLTSDVLTIKPDEFKSPPPAG
jgi:nucleotide-binding universal stress UspA family protein